MKNPIIKKVSDNRAGDWPPYHLVDMRDNPDSPDHPDFRGWTFEIEAKFGKTAPPQIQGSQYCVWFFPGYLRHEGSAVKAAFIKRCLTEGVTFVFIFKQIPPPTTEQVRYIEELNAKLRDHGGEIETAA